MLFFGPSFSHLVYYFGHLFGNSMSFIYIKKSKFWYAKFGSRYFGKTAAVVILFIIYDNLLNCLSSPYPGNNNLHLHVNLYLYLCNCILFCIFSCFYWGRAKFNKFNCILALCLFICLYKFGMIQYILKYKCICICILSYYTYSGTEYSDILFRS